MTSTVQGGGNPYVPQTTCTGCPIDTATGEFFHTFHDLSVLGRGMPLDLKRTYSSLAAQAGQSGPFGPGWADSYDWNLAFDASGNATVTSGNGSAVTFAPDGSGGFTAPSFVQADLVHNADGTYTFTGNDQHSYGFNASGQLTNESDANGYVTTLSYSGSQLTTVTDPAGRKLTFSYGSNNQISAVTDPANRKVSYTYDGSGNLTSVTDAGGGVWHFGYDANHLMLTMTDPRGGVTTNTYDASGRVSSQKDPAGRTTSFSDTPGGNGAETTTETDPSGHVTNWNYTNLTLSAVTRGAGSPQAATTTYAYDPATLRLTSVTDPNGHATTRTYDAKGNVLTSTDALNRKSTYTYNALNEVLTTTDPKAVTTTNTYDPRGNLTSTATPLGTGTATTTLAHADSSHPGDVTSMTDPNGHITTYAYDAAGNRTTVTDPVGAKTTCAFNAIGEMTTSTSPKANASGGGSATYAYDALGDLTSSTDPLGHTTTYAYDADQNPVSVKEPSGNTTTKTYDPDNEVTQITSADPHGTTLQTTSTHYSGTGQVTQQVDGAGGTTTYSYDALDHQVSKTDPLNRTTTYSYDPANNLTTVVQPDGKTTTYAYDAANEQMAISYSDGTTPHVAFTYDPDGQRTSMTDGTGTTTYTYDNLHHLTTDTQGNGSSVSYGYDPAGNLTGLTYPGGQSVSRTYDPANQLSAVTDWLGNKTSFGYDPDANLASQSSPNGVATTSSYDAADQLTTMATQHSGTNLQALNYGRNPNGLVSSENSRTYGYDGLNRLTSDSAGSAHYSYNGADELAGVQSQGGQAALSYDPANQLCWMSAGASTNGCANPPTGATKYTYDPNGNRTQVTPSGGSPTSLSYDQANRLTGYQAATSGSPPSNTPQGSYHALTPARICDTRAVGAGVAANQCDHNGTAPGTLGPQGSTTVQVTGQGGVPATGVSAVMLNVTATGTTSSSFLTVWPDGSPRPNASNLNWVAGQTRPNAVEVPVGPDGKIDVYNAAGNADVVLDVEGYVGPAAAGTGLYTPLSPARICDTRAAQGGTTANQCDHNGTGAGTLGAGGSVDVQVTGQGGVPATGVSAVVLNVTATDTTTSSFLTAWPTGATRPTASNLNWVGGQTIPNRVVVPVGAGGKVSLFNAAGNADVVVDVGGWYSDGSSPSALGATYTPVSPNRICDTRLGSGVAANQCDNNGTKAGTLGAAGTLPVQVNGKASVPANATAVVLNVTTTNTTASSFLTAYPAGATRPLASDLNWSAKQTSPNLVVVKLGSGGLVDMFNAAGNADVIVDVEGYYTQGPTTASYAYNGDGLRTSKTVNGAPEAFTWDQAEGVPSLIQDGSSSYVTGPGGLPLEQIDASGQVTYYHQDQLGSTRMLTDASGNVVSSYSYDAYGRQTQTTGSVAQPFGFAGQYTDSESGLNYLRARYYDPSTAQFTGVDPLADTTGAPYSYAHDDPVDNTDPSGLVTIPICYGGGASLFHIGVERSLCYNLGWHGYTVTTQANSGLTTDKEFSLYASNTIGVDRGPSQPSPCACPSVDVGGSYAGKLARRPAIVGPTGDISVDCHGAVSGGQGGIMVGLGAPGLSGGLDASNSQTVLTESWSQFWSDQYTTVRHPTSIWRGLGL